MTLTVEMVAAAIPIAAIIVGCIWKAAAKVTSIDAKLDAVMAYLGLDAKTGQAIQQPKPTPRKKARR